ncbi:YHS domain-containing (seleno)protein [Spongiimicrobium sp. 2-473A-2-J]|uniref:YHS domain-containing (seleno)protein n=1 Tax=Eudoraea algarum TaxID=3417568 RepID=UPI003D3666D0
MTQKFFIRFLILFITINAFGQNADFNKKNGYAAEGYDVVAYFDQQVQKGKEDLVYVYHGAKFSFSTTSNLNKFKSAPDKYVPQYGGWCAYAIGKSGKKVKIDPETYEIRDGKLYLFYNFRSTNTLEKWISEGPETLRDRADRNWTKIVDKGK